MRLNAFDALRPAPDRAGGISTVPYDVVTTEEARAMIRAQPSSFLRVGRAEADMAPGTDPHTDAVYAHARDVYQGFLADGRLRPGGVREYYVYSQSVGTHTQCGVVGCCHALDYERGIILQHEKTRADKREDRRRLIATLRAQTGPVFLMYRDRAAIDALVAAETAGAPLFDFVADDGVRHRVWRVRRTAEMASVFSAVPLAYIADGHHRAAAAVDVAAQRRAECGDGEGREEVNWFMGVLFPASQLRILPYNRLVQTLNGLDVPAFLAAVRQRYDVAEGAGERPDRPGRIGMYVAGTWYALTCREQAADPVARLDVSHLQSRLLEPVLGIIDPRTDRRIDFVGGARGTGALKQAVDEGRAAVAFSMYPVTTQQIMDIADAGQIMPPKSTWFEPKLRDGLLVHAF